MIRYHRDSLLWFIILLSLPVALLPAGNIIGDLNGDNQVNLPDLSVFSSQWLTSQDISLADLILWYPLDAESGSVVTDASGLGQNGVLTGGSWQPGNGKIGGALELDGVNDYIGFDYLLNPWYSKFSVFAWIKGGGANEVIITQLDAVGGGTGREWLQIDPSYGRLMTRLNNNGTPLTSTVVVTDGQWHHVGFSWDGARRRLYVDGVEVAADSSNIGNLQYCIGAMQIGIGKSLGDYSCFSGLIDDVRIYSRALSAEEIGMLAGPQLSDPSNADLDGINGVTLNDFYILSRNWRIGPKGEYRCIWADTWNASILNASQCQELITTCRSNNINAVIVEVRKVGDAYYHSNLEPRATNISGGSSFDPLGYLLQIAHDTSGGQKYIEVHAWFVAQRIAKSGTLNSGHVLSRHPEYTMLDKDSNPYDGTNLWLDPGHPGAVDHNVAVMLDCLSQYDIDGVNLDYIRYPGNTWGYNAESIRRFNQYYGKSGTPATGDPDFCDWRRECVTQQVKKIYVKSLKLKPSVVVTVDSTAWGSGYTNYYSSSPYAGVFQDWIGWLQLGIIDYNALMGYKVEALHPGQFAGWCNLSLANDYKRGSIISTGAYLQTDIQDGLDQLLYARSQGAAGLNIYDWGSEVNGSVSGETRSEFYSQLKAQVYPQWVDPPVHAWKAHPTTSIVEGNVTAAGSPLDHAWVAIDGLPDSAVVTDGSGWYAIMDVPPGNWSLRFMMSGYPDKIVPLTVTNAGQILSRNVDLGS